MDLLNFPREILRKIIFLLSKEDLCCLRVTCSDLRDFCDLDEVWTNLASAQFGVSLQQCKFSTRIFYQKVLQYLFPFSPDGFRLGTAQHGWFYKIYFCEKSSSIKIMSLGNPGTIMLQLQEPSSSRTFQEEGLYSISLNEHTDEVEVLSCFPDTDYDHWDNEHLMRYIRSSVEFCCF